MTLPYPVSVHGGHSGQFCSHAKNTLEEVVLAYIEKGYPWVGITEHMPPPADEFIYPEERQAGLNAAALHRRFADYIATARRLQSKYAEKITIYVGFETEDCSGCRDEARALIRAFSPDYMVGSVHHVNDMPFDTSPDIYTQTAVRCGGLDALYCAYFDQQFEMIRALKPHVVGHLDIIRIFDSDYPRRLVKRAIWDKIVRNLELIKQLDLILDFNLRPLSRGEAEPYLSAPILQKASELGIDIVPGDDSHGIDSIGELMQRGIQILRSAGISTDWRRPVDRSPG